VKKRLTPRYGKLVTALGICAVVLLVYWSSPVITVIDSVWTIPLAETILSGHTTALDAFAPFAPNDYRIEQVGAHFYSYFPVGVPLLTIPFVAIANQFEPLASAHNGRAAASDADPLTGTTEMQIASVLTALAVGVVFFVALEVGLSLKLAALTAGVFAFATPAWSTASRALWSETGSLLVLSLALYGLLAARRDSRWLALAGFALGFSYVVRPTNALSLIAFSIYLLVAYRRKLRALAGYGLALASPLIPFALYNLSIYAAPLSPYYQASRLLRLYNFRWALTSTLFSPNRGLFIYSPFLLLVPIGAVWLIRRAPRDGWNYALIAILSLNWITVSLYWQWWGGTSFGPRLFTDLFPYLLYFFTALLRAWPSFSFPSRAALTTTLAVTLALSGFIHYQGATNLETLAWNWTPTNVDDHPDRTDDWSDLQFLRGVQIPVRLTHPTER
jgi:hypothetical protein